MLSSGFSTHSVVPRPIYSRYDVLCSRPDDGTAGRERIEAGLIVRPPEADRIWQRPNRVLYIHYSLEISEKIWLSDSTIHQFTYYRYYPPSIYIWNHHFRLTGASRIAAQFRLLLTALISLWWRRCLHSHWQATNGGCDHISSYNIIAALSNVLFSLEVVFARVSRSRDKTQTFVIYVICTFKKGIKG